MPITGKFEADFSDFSSATKGAEEDLKSLGSTATTTTAQITDLEKATSTAGPRASTLAESYTKFDGALNAVGIHIGPQVRAIEDLGSAAGKTAGEIGLLGTAGLVVGAAMAGWDVGRWIAKVTGADAAVSGLTSRLMGWGDLAKETAGATQDAIDLAFTRTGIHATTAAEALALNTKWAKENQAAAKENAAEVKAAADAHDKWEAAMQAVTAAGKGWQAILADINPRTVEAAQNALRHSANQQDVAIAYKLTETQVRAVVDSLAAEKKAIDDAAAAQRLHDAELMDSYNKRIGVMKELEAAQAGHYGLEGQIGMLQQLAANEDAYTRATYAQLESEKDRAKLIEANAKRQAEIETSIGKLRADETAIMARSTLEAVKAQTELNKVYGLDAKGAIQLPIDALTTYRQKVEELNATLTPGAELTAKLALAEHDLTQSLFDEAKASDAAATAGTKANDTKTQAIALTAQQTAAARANASYGGGTLGAVTGTNTDPAILGYMAQGYTLNEALMIASGQGAYIIGRSPTQLAKAAGRASGGPVEAGTSYIVGERGPELFSPAVNGAISPSLAGAGGISIVIQGSVLSTQAELAALVERALVAAYRRGGNRLPV